MGKHTIKWRGIEIEITYTPDQFGMVDHIELHTEKKTQLPVCIGRGVGIEVFVAASVDDIASGPLGGSVEGHKATLALLMQIYANGLEQQNGSGGHDRRRTGT